MSGSWREILVDVDGQVRLDDLPVASFEDAIAVLRADGPVLVRCVDEASGQAPTWFRIEADGGVSVVQAPDTAPASASQEEEEDEEEPAALVPLEPDEASLFSSTSDLAVSPSAVSPSPVVTSRRRTLVSRRVALMGGVVVVGAVLAGGAVVWGPSLVGSGPAASPAPDVAVTPVAARVVTLPGFSSTSTWSTGEVAAAAAMNDRVVSVSGSTVTVREAASGEVLASAEISGDTTLMLRGTVAGVPAIAAVSTTQALVWIGDGLDPVAVELSEGRQLTARTGELVVVGADRSFALVTMAGLVPVTPPRPEMILLGATGGTLVWAGAPSQVVLASPNGTPIQEVSLAAPTSGATITPKLGWVRAASTSTVVVGWTLPDGQTVTGVHAAPTGQLLTQFPGTGTGVLAPAGTGWLSDGHLVDLTDSTVTALPDGFTASQFLDAAVYGALASGENALLFAGGAEPLPVDPSTVRPFAISDGMLLALTNGELQAFPSAK